MATSENEMTSPHESYSEEPKNDVAYVLDERRRAALAEIDSAKFS